jgi:hypothetical protein
MNDAPSGLTEFGFWLAVAIIVVAIVWAGVKKQQMKHELTLKLLEKGEGMDKEFLAKLLASHNASVPQKSPAQQNREGGFFVGFLFLAAGLALFSVGIVSMRGPRPLPVFRPGQGMVFQTPPAPEGTEFAWMLWMGLGVLAFAFGCWCWFRSEKEFKRAKAEEELSRD